MSSIVYRRVRSGEGGRAVNAAESARRRGESLAPERPLLLGSGSPRRSDILATLGVPFVARPAECDESPRARETPRAYLARVVAAKRDGVLDLLRRTPRPDIIHASPALLVADTTVVLDGRMLGKPRDEAHARAMLRALSGRRHEVLTRFCVARISRLEPLDSTLFDEGSVVVGPEHATTVRTLVEFRALSSSEIAAYASTGEGSDKAGAYAVQGLGAFAVRRLSGSYTNVVGLPACEVIEALQTLGLVRTYPMAAGKR